MLLFFIYIADEINCRKVKGQIPLVRFVVDFFVNLLNCVSPLKDPFERVDDRELLTFLSNKPDVLITCSFCY